MYAKASGGKMDSRNKRIEVSQLSSSRRVFSEKVYMQKEMQESKIYLLPLSCKETKEQF